ncbi:alpha/beta fold hydrolase [Sphingomonas sp. IC-11]|uniref:alpha/beta fold hydrolase n=1 Tax=Sphingomonas sp. IC-11 TaxID=2898528 RepID=UPI001E374FF7|nr:alpha/beta fold hydrolase [Sphingomonas sp. IC-11]MCD2315113.1 alpha/beta fold hydrolase [Sphingomonas sp. IC-11]
MRFLSIVASTAALATALPATAQTTQPVATPANPAPAPSAWPSKEADVTLPAFRFKTGETMDVRMHYTTLGTPHRRADGQIDNAVMVLHGTGGTGKQFLSPQFADELYGPGQPFDIRTHYVILPDNIGHGASSKPSDGKRMAFPKYDYDDMVAAQKAMLEKLGVTRLKVILGTSMGCMHAFVWGETFPGFAERLAPFACLPVPIAGLNRMWRKLSIDAIQADPAWRGGNYTAQPEQGLRTAASLSIIAGANPLALQKQYPTRAASEAFLAQAFARNSAGRDANDYIYQLDASRNYDPSAALEKITVPVLWINSEDDFINPSGYGITDAAAKRMPHATFRLIAASPETKGHGTHTWAKFWKADLAGLLREPVTSSPR